MARALGLGIGISFANALKLSGAGLLLASETDGLAIDFTDASMTIKDTATPANAYSSTGTVSSGALVGPGGKLMYSSPSNKLCLQSNGFYSYGAHNLILQSENLASGTWIKSNVTSTSSVTGAAGATLSKMEETTANADHTLYQTFTVVQGLSYTLTVDCRAAERSNVVIRTNITEASSGSFINLAVDLSTGTKTANGSSFAVTQLGTSEYRITLSVTSQFSSASASITLMLSNAAVTTNAVPSYTGTTGSGAYFGRFHLRLTPSVSDYIATTTAAVYSFPYEWNSSGTALGVRIEEARTNLLKQSVTLPSTEWATLAATRTAAAAVSITGQTNAIELKETATTNFHYIVLTAASGGLALTAATTYTASIYVKDGGRRYVQLAFDDGANGCNATYDLQAASVTQAAAHGGTGVYTSSSITSVGNGWYRIALTGQVGAGVSYRFLLLLANSATPGFAPSYAGSTSNFVYLSHAQIELGSFATSPIETAGSTVTRAADNMSWTATSTEIKSGDGTIFSDAYMDGYVSSSVMGMSFNNSASGEQSRQEAYASSTTSILSLGRDASASTTHAMVVSGLTAFPAKRKSAIAFATNDFELCVNGTLAGGDTLGAAPTNANKIWIARNYAATAGAQWVKKVLYIPRRMSNADMQVLTT